MIEVTEKSAADQPWIEILLRNAWGATSLIVRGKQIEAAALPALVVSTTGLLTYRRAGPVVEIISLNATTPGQGIGTALIDALAQRCASWSANAITVITTNDNLTALGFYQRRGFALDALFAGAIAAARQIKPAIPMIAANGIPIRDEIRLRWEVGALERDE